MQKLTKTKNNNIDVAIFIFIFINIAGRSSPPSEKVWLMSNPEDVRKFLTVKGG